MKKSIIFFLMVAGFSAFAQTNTFPNTGNVGVGILTPAFPFEVFHDYGNGGSGKLVKIGGKSWWHWYDWEEMQLGFSQLRSIYEGNNVWGLGIRTGLADGVGEEIIRFNGHGMVGIGTISPSSKLDVRGAVTIDRGADAVIFTGTAAFEQNRYLQLINSPTVANASGLKAGGVLVADAYDYADPAKNDLIVKGNVGIGTSSPLEKLSVNGKIRAREVKVEVTGWADYVFAADYALNELREVEKYIKENGHLPDIPSAKDVENEGISLGEMNVKLLKKIEELTLYLIQKDKEISELKKLEMRMAELEKKMVQTTTRTLEN